MNIGLIFQLLFLFLLPVGLIFFQIGDSLTHGVKTGEWMPFADKTVGRLLASGEQSLQLMNDIELAKKNFDENGVKANGDEISLKRREFWINLFIFFIFWYIIYRLTKVIAIYVFNYDSKSIPNILGLMGLALFFVFVIETAYILFIYKIPDFAPKTLIMAIKKGFVDNLLFDNSFYNFSSITTFLIGREELV